MGIFATGFIPKGRKICTLQGEEIGIAELKRRYEAGIERLADPIQVAQRRYLDIDRPYIYFNHSCDPNAAYTGRCDLTALRDIEPGHEITFDYSTSENTWHGFGKHAHWEMECRCGHACCRGIITQFRYLGPDVQERYLQAKALPNFILRELRRDAARGRRPSMGVR